jgi:hypothetical protein
MRHVYEETRSSPPPDQRRRSVLLLVGACALILVCCSTARREYGLPVALGSASDDVRKILGKPTQRYGAPQIGDNGNVTLSQTDDKIVEWYYPAGIVAFFDSRPADCDYVAHVYGLQRLCAIRG